MCAHLPHAAANRKSRPFLNRWVAQALLSVKGNIQAAHCLSILLDHGLRIELGVNHDCVDRGMAEKRLNHMNRRVVVEMLGSKYAAAIVRMQAERRAIGLPCTR